MAYQQLVQPNLSIVGQSGLCLAYVRAVFGATYSYPSATVGWQNTQYKHDGPPPAGVSVPVWFRYNGPDGHVAVWDGSRIHSTSAQGMKTFGSPQELCSWMGEGMTYLGWSEDVDQLRVVQEDDMTTLSATSLRIIEAYVGGWDIEKSLSGADDSTFVAAEGWKDPNEVIYNIFINAGDWRSKVLAMQNGSSQSDAQAKLAELEKEVQTALDKAK